MAQLVLNELIPVTCLEHCQAYTNYCIITVEDEIL